MKNYIYPSTLALLAASLLVACAKPRDPAFPEGTADQIFSVAELGSVNGEGSATITTSEAKTLSPAQQSRALYEKGIVKVNAFSFSGTSRLRFMFEDLEVSGRPEQTLRLVFGLGKDFLTVYKVVTNAEELTAFEKALAVSPEQVKIELESQKTGEPVPARKAIEGSSALVPLFKYKVEDAGIVERTKNENKEETAILKLRKTKFAMATHIKLKNEAAERIMILPSKEKKVEQEEVYLSEIISKARMSAGQLRDELGVTTTLEDNSAVALSLEEKELKIALITADQKIIPRFKLAITYVRPYLPQVPGESSANKDLELLSMATNSAGLVRIKKGEAVDLATPPAAAAAPAAAAVAPVTPAATH